MQRIEFDELYRQHSGSLHFWVTGKMRNKTSAEDVVSQAFSKAWEHREELRGDFKSWVYTIASNEMRSIWKRSKRTVPLEDEHNEIPEHYDFIEQLARYMEWRRAEQVSKLLDDTLRRALLCHVEGLSLKESARRLRVPAGTAGRRIWQAKQKMRVLCAA